MRGYQSELEAAVGELEGRYAELKDAARRRLGSLFHEDDYPASLVGLFAVCWDYPAVEPPDYLVQLSPELYRRERERVAARFEEAVRLAEEAFRGEFARLGRRPAATRTPTPACKRRPHAPCRLATS